MNLSNFRDVQSAVYRLDSVKRYRREMDRDVTVSFPLGKRESTFPDYLHFNGMGAPQIPESILQSFRDILIAWLDGEVAAATEALTKLGVDVDDMGRLVP